MSEGLLAAGQILCCLAGLGLVSLLASVVVELFYREP